MWGRKGKVLAVNKKFERNKNKHFNDITITIRGQMCHHQSIYVLQNLASLWCFEDSCYIIYETPAPIDSGEDLISRLPIAAVTVLETQGILEKVLQSFARRCRACIDVETHLSTYCDCYVSKTLVFISSCFSATLFISDPTLPYQNCFFICTLPSFIIWIVCSRALFIWAKFHHPYTVSTLNDTNEYAMN